MNKNRTLLNFDSGTNMNAVTMMYTVIKLSIPAILAQISSIVMQYIDAAMVGSLGAYASASIGLTSSTTWLLNGLCSATALGFSVQIAQFTGAKRTGEARNVFRQALIITTLMGLLVSMIALSVRNTLPVWLGGDEDILESSSKYFAIYALTIPANQLRFIAGNSLQCSGDMKTPSILNITMCILDVIFNFFLIYPARVITFAGHEFTIAGAGAGLTGAAIGTALAGYVTAFAMLFTAFFKSPVLALKLGGYWKIKKHTLKTALKVSVPSAVEQIITCGAYVCGTFIVAPLGTVSVAANSLAVTAESFCYMPGYGIGAATTTLVGQSLGAQRKDMAKKFAYYSVWLAMVIMTVTGALMYIFAPQIFAVLTPAYDVRKYGVEVLRIEAFAEPLYAASIVCNGALRGAGDTFVPSILNLVSMWGVRIVLAFILVPYLGLHGFWIAMCIELCVRGILFLARLIRGKWLNKNLIHN